MRPEDADALFAVFGDSAVMRYWSTLPHQDVSETQALVRETIAADPAITAEFAVVFGGRVIGKAGFWRMPEIGYLLRRDHWRRGFATEAVQALIAYGFAERGLDRITADVDPENTASLGLLAKLGFQETGRARNTLEIGGKWFDSVYLELRPQRAQKCPPADG